MSIRAHSTLVKFAVIVSMLVGALVAGPAQAAAVKWETLFTAQDVRDHLSTPAGRQQALDFCRRMGITKVYIEVFRDGYQADASTLETARDFFRKAGLEVSGSVTTTQLGKPSTGWKIVACYTNRANQQHLAQIFRYAARFFNEVIIDDFFFTDCECSECSAAKGDLSWGQYRRELMLRMSREDVLGAARSVNPNVKIILKFPEWYDEFQNRGYVPDKESALYDRIWVGTELRDPSLQEWGHKQQYGAFFIYRWLHSIAGAKTGGAWFDPYGTDPVLYMDQAWTAVLAGAPEIFLFHYGDLNSPHYSGQAAALADKRAELDRLGQLVGDWKGIPAYKPVSSDPGSESYIFDQIGMLGIPLLPTAKFPANSKAAMFAEYSMSDPDFVPELNHFLAAGGTAFITEGLAHRLNRDPRLSFSAIDLSLRKGELIHVFQPEKGHIVVFSDALPKLSYVDTNDRVEQLTPDLRSALNELRRQVSEFTVTSLDAPPRVAIYPMGRRVAVMNYTELPVACHIQKRDMSGHLTSDFDESGARVAPDGETLDLPPHSLIVVQ